VTRTGARVTWTDARVTQPDARVTQPDARVTQPDARVTQRLRHAYTATVFSHAREASHPRPATDH